ncbi:MAG TPA: hypothetical protein VFK41_04325 [Nocardioidaceae bacterium]|nr:hypothetical protein [Nocardioidaceae bacterium]
MAEPPSTGGVPERESQVAVLVGGLLVLFFGMPAVALAVSLGAGASAAAGVGLVGIAWLLRTPREARIIRVLVALLGAAALVSAVIDVLG